MDKISDSDLSASIEVVEALSRALRVISATVVDEAGHALIVKEIDIIEAWARRARIVSNPTPFTREVTLRADA